MSRDEAGDEEPFVDAGHLVRSPRWPSLPHGTTRRTYDQLYNEARERGLKGRSKMSKAQLERALSR